MQQQGVPLQVDYTRVAAHIRELQPRALTPGQYEDVIVLLEYMRDELIQRETELSAKTLLIEERERTLVQREKDVTIRHKAVAAVASVTPRRTWWTYLKR
jgi:hypothetical protein